MTIREFFFVCSRKDCGTRSEVLTSKEYQRLPLPLFWTCSEECIKQIENSVAVRPFKGGFITKRDDF
jgi:hypothetical protein